ncbi:MAG: InlB B-repeat-containing protein [Christensenellaceae bacterium]|nr:InlB B-repeat-containing protein [Christensenellaceae bacterium]
MRVNIKISKIMPVFTKTAKILTILVFLSFFIIPVLGCGSKTNYKDNETYFETELFECITFVTSEIRVQICGLTAKGLEQEELIIPAQINGLKVDRLGYSGFMENRSNMSEAKPRKLFLPAGLYIYKHDELFLCLEKVILNTNKTYLAPYNFRSVPIFVPSSSADRFSKSKWSYTRAANVTFYLNSRSYTDVYCIDDIDLGDKILTVPQPIEVWKTFMGWFTEKECENEWDFENDIMMAYHLELYAKWIKN